MLFIYKVIAFQLAWIGPFAVYLSSNNQWLIKQVISKTLAWSIFITLFLLGIILLKEVYNLPAAIFFVLIITMLSWIVISLWSPHCQNIKIIASALSLTLLLAAWFGGSYVA